MTWTVADFTCSQSSCRSLSPKHRPRLMTNGRCPVCGADYSEMLRDVARLHPSNGSRVIHNLKGPRNGSD